MWIGLLWQVWVWGRRCLKRLHDLTENAAAVPDLDQRLERLERVITELACVRDRERKGIEPCEGIS